MNPWFGVVVDSGLDPRTRVTTTAGQGGAQRQQTCLAHVTKILACKRLICSTPPMGEESASAPEKDRDCDSST